MWDEPEYTTSWEDSEWNFSSDYYRRKQEQARRMKEAYYERLERAARHPPDEDEWNK